MRRIDILLAALVVAIYWRTRIVYAPKRGCCQPDGCRVIVAGMTRSGSTWQYNAVRLALISTGKHAGNVHGHPTDTSTNADMLAAFRNQSWSVAKAHHFWPDGAAIADCVFLTHRDARDVVLSWLRLQNRTDTLQLFVADTARFIGEYMLWKDWCRRKRTCHELSFKELRQNPVDAITAMQWHMDPNASVESAQINDQIAKLYNSTTMDWDKETAFHTKHITNGGSQMWKIGDWDNVTLTNMDNLFSSYHLALGYPLSHVNK